MHISHLSNFVLVSQIQCKITSGECKYFTFTQVVQKNALYFEIFYTAGANFTRPLDKAPGLSISIVIRILSSDTETSAATPLGGDARKVLAK